MTETLNQTPALDAEVGQAGHFQRPTPADAMPDVSRDARVPGGKERSLPPEIGPDALAVLEGRSFMYSDSIGDVPGGTIGGPVHGDTHFLSKGVLTVNFVGRVPAFGTHWDIEAIGSNGHVRLSK